MNDATTHNEKELLFLISQGDEQAFTKLFYTWHQLLGDYILAITKSKSLTEEIVQDTFLKIWQQRAQLKEIDNFRSWLFKVGKNYTFNCLRNLAREKLRQENWQNNVTVEEANSASDNKEAYYQLLEKAVASLPAQQQKSYRLSREQGLTHEAIAQEMQLSRETVKRHISLALQNIADYMRAHGGQAMSLLMIMADLYKNN